LRGSDHGADVEDSDHIVFEDFMGRPSTMLPNLSRKSYQLAPGIEIGSLHPHGGARDGDEDDILEITL
jgi:hypothetical protein